MASVDELIDAINNRDELTAQKLLEQQPTLATSESLRDDVLRSATPLHWAAHRNMTNLCGQLIESEQTPTHATHNGGVPRSLGRQTRGASKQLNYSSEMAQMLTEMRSA